MRMRVSASSTACCTAVLTRVKEASFCPARLAATLSVTLQQVGGEAGHRRSRQRRRNPSEKCSASAVPVPPQRHLSAPRSLVCNLLCHVTLHELLLEPLQGSANILPGQRLQQGTGQRGGGVHEAAGWVVWAGNEGQC